VDGSGQIADPHRLLDQFHAAFVQAGGKVRRCRAEAVTPLDKGVGVRIEGRTVRFDHVVIAAGVASRDLLRPLGHKVPIIAERGYHVQQPVADADWPATTPPIVFEDRSMIVTRFEGGLRAASFVVFSRPDAPPDPRKWRRLREHAAALGLPIRAEAREWMGARPTLPDYLPAIGQSERAHGVYYAFGHQHLGLTLAALTGERIAAMMTENFSDPRLSLARFGKGKE
jgi:D-hydroxyproline dehydrogenase